MASEKGHADVVKLLLGHETIDVNAADNRGNTPLKFASDYGQTEVMELLKTKGGRMR